MSVHYKFKSALEYDTVTFDGLHISVRDLKNAIMQQKRIGKNTDFDLQVTNAQTKEVYDNEEALIPKNTSLLIARVPSQQTKPKTWEGYGSNNSPIARVEDAGPAAKAMDLSSLDASEEDKIKAMMSQSTQDYDPSNYMKIRGANQMGAVPANYRCFKCHQGGHWIKDCPLSQGPEPIEIKKSTGIPRSFMVPVEGPQVPGAMMTPNGSFAVPVLDHQAYNEKPQPAAPPEVKNTEIPEDLLCSICTDLLTDAVMIPCCGNSFCDECIRSCLLESEEHECPDCHERNISPGTLIPNRFLRTAVGNFKSTTGYVKRLVHKPSTIPIEEMKIEEKPPTPPAKNEEKPVISEADSTEPPKVTNQTEITPEIVPDKEPLPGDGPPGVSPKREPSPTPQKITNVIDNPRNYSDRQKTVRDRSPRRHHHMRNSPSYDKQHRMEDRPGTPTVDEPGVGSLGNLPPINVFVGPPPYTSGPPPVIPVMGIPPGMQIPPPISGFPGTTQPPPTYQQPPPIQPNFRLPPPGMGSYLPNPYPTARNMFDNRPPMPQTNYVANNYNAGHRMERDYGRDVRRNRTPPGIIDDPLEAFNRMLREKDERERKAKQRKARSYSRSSSRSFSRSPYRMRSRSPRRRISRSRSRSFSMSRSRSRSFSPNVRISPGRQFSPKHSPHRSGHRYRSPVRNSPPRYRYKENNPPRERNYQKDERNDYRERDYQFDYGYERDRDRGRQREQWHQGRKGYQQQQQQQSDHFYNNDINQPQTQQPMMSSSFPPNRYQSRDAYVPPVQIPPLMPPGSTMRRYDDVVPPGTEPPVPGLDTPRFDTRFNYDQGPSREKHEEHHSRGKSPEAKSRYERKSKEREHRHSTPDKNKKKREEHKDSDDDKKKKDKDKKKKKEKKESDRKKRKEKREKKDHDKKDKEEKEKVKEDKKKPDAKEEPKEIKQKTPTPEKKQTPPPSPTHDLYAGILNEEIDKTLVENYVKVKSPEQLEPEPEPPSEPLPIEDYETDILDLHTNEAELKVELDKSDVLAPMPEKSRWEIEEEPVLPSTPDSRGEDSRSSDREKGKVTNEVLKRAENAIFAKAINAIRPIEIKKISLDRIKLYSGDKEEIPDVRNIQVTIPCVLEEGVGLPSGDATPKPRLSVKERLGCKVDDLDRIVKVDKPYDRNRSHSLSPLSRRAGELNRNLGQGERRDDHRRDKKHRDIVQRDRRPPHRDVRSYRDEKDRRDRDRDRHRDDIKKSRDNRKDDKSKLNEFMKNKSNKSRSKSLDKDKKKRKDKKDRKKEKDKTKKHKKDEPISPIPPPQPPPQVPLILPNKTKEEKLTDSLKILERRKPPIDEASFIPDYEMDDKKIKENEKKRLASTTGREDASKKRKVEVKPSSSDDSSDSSSEDDKKRKKHKKHKKKRSRKSSTSTTDSDSDSSDGEKERKKKKHKKSKKKKKKSKHK